MRPFRFFLCVCASALIASTNSDLKGQPNPTDHPVTTETVLGMSPADFRQVRDVLVEVTDDPEIAALTEQIERLMEQREKLIIAKAKQRYPVHRTKIEKVDTELTKLRDWRKRERPEEPDGTPSGGGD